MTAPINYAVGVRRLVNAASRASSWSTAARLLDEAAHVARQAAAVERKPEPASDRRERALA